MKAIRLGLGPAMFSSFVASCSPATDAPSSTDESALTDPSKTGGENLPAGLTIVPPFPPGITHTITMAYGIKTHIHTNTLGLVNDYYALDFDFANDEPIYPIADGVVIYAGTATAGWATFGNIVFVEHVVGSEHYESLYAHLNSLSVSTGSVVTTGTRIGGAGGTGGWPTHLHVALYHGAKFQNDKSGIGPYGGKAVVPEPFSECYKNGSCQDLKGGDQLMHSSGGASCSCPNGEAFINIPVDPRLTYCGFRVCGNDREWYDCNTNGWDAAGVECGPTTCKCSGGTAFPGIAIDPAMTYCGFHVCGNDNHYYECGPNGWEFRGGDCQ